MGDFFFKEALMVLPFKLGLFSGFWMSLAVIGGTFFCGFFFLASYEETIAGFSFPLAHRYTGSVRVQTEKTSEEAGG